MRDRWSAPSRNRLQETVPTIGDLPGLQLRGRCRARRRQARVEKLLIQAASVAGSPEAEAFTDKAMTLIAEYGITEVDRQMSADGPGTITEGSPRGVNC
ncbi:DUF2786 domain-containing protein [Rhodococcus ruber]|uniref:DUF2786 domain-containing protein n=1 Tax=Rhodococcus ruber TaxID=1830 RepID=UPI000F51EA97